MTSHNTRLCTPVETGQILMNDWSDDEDNLIDIVILPLDKVDSMTNDKEIDTNGEKLGPIFLRDVTGLIVMHLNSPLTDAVSTKPTDSEPTDKDQKLSLGKKKLII